MDTLRRRILQTASDAGEGHIPSALSVLDILWVLYDQILKIDPLDPTSDDRDRFVLSKGHASLGLYAVLAEKNFIPASELKTFGKYKSRLGGHPDTTKIPGVEASTGSLGHGFPMAVGMALALKIRKSAARVFVLIGDGEANEGTVWESCLLAAHHKLSNLVCIVDYNHSTDRALQMGNFVEKFQSFGWAGEIVSGHDQNQLAESFLHVGDVPRVVVAETIKGFGVSSLENNPEWHHRVPKASELPALLESVR